MLIKVLTAQLAALGGTLLLSSCTTLPFEGRAEETIGSISLADGNRMEKTILNFPLSGELYNFHLRTSGPISESMKRTIRFGIVISETNTNVAPVCYDDLLAEFVETSAGSAIFEYRHPDSIGGGFYPKPNTEYTIKVRVRGISPIAEVGEAEVVMRAGS